MFGSNTSKCASKCSRLFVWHANMCFTLPSALLFNWHKWMSPGIFPVSGWTRHSQRSDSLLRRETLLEITIRTLRHSGRHVIQSTYTEKRLRLWCGSVGKINARQIESSILTTSVSWARPNGLKSRPIDSLIFSWKSAEIFSTAVGQINRTMLF